MRKTQEPVPDTRIKIYVMAWSPNLGITDASLLNHTFTEVLYEEGHVIRYELANGHGSVIGNSAIRILSKEKKLYFAENNYLRLTGLSYEDQTASLNSEGRMYDYSKKFGTCKELVWLTKMTKDGRRYNTWYNIPDASNKPVLITEAKFIERLTKDELKFYVRYGVGISD